MSLLLGDMLVRYKADITDLTVKTAMATGEIDSFSSGAKVAGMAVAGGLMIAGAAIIGIGALSTKMAADFQQSTNLLITSAGEIPGNIDMIRKGLLQMSVDTATSTDDLVKGMFNVESAGYRGADALKVEKAAAEGAKVENADLAAVTDVLTTAMHNYNLPASQAVDVMNSMRMSASMGKMHMDDLTQALKNVLPIASQAGVSLTGVEAALSTMSQAGDKGASAGTHLSQMLTYLLAPSSKATGALKEVGLTTQKISDEMKVSLPGTIQMITQAVGEKFPVGSAKYIAALSAIVGGNKSMKAMLELSGVSLNQFIQDASQLSPTMKANSTAVDGWSTVQSNFNFKLDAAKNGLNALLITLGTALLPKLGEIVGAIAPVITSFLAWENKTHGIENAIAAIIPFFLTMFDTVKSIMSAVLPIFLKFIGILGLVIQWVSKNKDALEAFKIVAIGLGALIAGLMIVTLIGVVVVLTAVAVVIGVVIGAIMGVMWVIHHWGEIIGWLGGLWHSFISWLSGIFGSIVNWFVQPIRDAINQVVGWFSWLYNHNYYFKALVDFIVNVFSSCISWLKGAWQSVVGFLAGLWHGIVNDATKLWQSISNIFSSAWSNYVARPLTSLWNSILNFVNGWPSQAVQWGKNLIQGLINGILGMIGNLGGALGNVAGKIGQFLGFHSPSKEGAGRELDIWGPNMVRGFASGVDRTIPVLTATIQHMMFVATRPMASYPMAYPIRPSAVAVAAASNASQSSSNQGQTIILELDSHRIAEITNRATDRTVRLKLGERGRAA